ncbi:MAG: SPASM domain-containing protein [Candidatus Riflebacteria bacterium]|nr:SPASM domain-containing protein [Candidatus Riflebacteria bacterium]
MHTHSKLQIYAYHLDIIGKSSIPFPQADPAVIEYRRKWEQNPRQFIVSDFPLHLDIEVSGRCNLMCQHCIRHSRRTNIGDMEFDLFKMIIDQGMENGLCSIDPDWLGESFLNPRLIEMITYAKQKGILDIRISTNGVLINKEMSHKIIESDLDRIIFSIDAASPLTYQKIKVGSDLELVLKNIEFLTNEKEKQGIRNPEIIVQIIDQKQTHEELMAFIHYWRTRADMVRISIYQSPDGNPRDKRRAQNKPESIFPCPQLWQRLTIAWDGTVYPCTGDNACRFPLGNVKKDSIKNIWHGEKMTSLRRMHINYEADDLDLCSHCDLNKIPREVNTYRNPTGENQSNEL